MARRRRLLGLEEILESRRGGALSNVLCQEGPGLRDRLRDKIFHCNVDFGLVEGASKAARSALRKPLSHRELSDEWIALRLTLEHLVYFTGRLQLFLAAAVADEYAERTTSSRQRLRFASFRKHPNGGRSVGATVDQWRRLLARRVKSGDRAGEYRLLADAALVVGAANVQFTGQLVRMIAGTTRGIA